MGCCISHPLFGKQETVYEVTLDADGVAQRVPKGQGTHFIHVSPNNETHLEEKTEQLSQPAATHDTNNNNKWPSLTTPPAYSNKRVAPVESEKAEMKKETST